MNKRLKRVLSRVGITFLILFILFFIFRNPLLHWQLGRTISSLQKRTGATLDIKTSSFSGLLSVSMRDISLTPVKGDTLLIADTLNVRLSLWTLFVGVIRVKELYFSGASVTVSCRDSICNYEGFLNHKSNSGLSPGTGINYSVLLKSVLDRAYNFAPQRSNLQNIILKYKNDTLERIFQIKEFHSDENSLYGHGIDLKNQTSWRCAGLFSQVKHTLMVKCFPEDGEKIKLPLSNELFGLSIGFDTLNLSLNSYKWSGNVFNAHGSVSIENLSAFHKRISDDTIRISNLSFDVNFVAGKTYFEIDSSSIATLASIRIHPFIKYERVNDKKLTVQFKTDEIPSTAFFSSLPEGMFDEVRSIQADGDLQFVLNFKIDTSEPDSLFFYSSLKKKSFRIRKFGTSDLMKMNDEFVQMVYEKDRIVRSFNVGYSNPFYVSLDSISPYFINSVLTSEDGNFYFHNGFNEDAFRKSIITNFKAGKFVRGGSTISMQLVKNVYLNRKKTIARKAEEALLVWLIESNRLYSKKRMLEVYMNIIELGPGIYGIGEASDFYFRKHPMQLSLSESIFLASLLPHPKWFKYSFDAQGNLKPYLADYYRVVSDFMLRKNLLTQYEHDSLRPYVTLVGPAREMVIPTDSIPEEDDVEQE